MAWSARTASRALDAGVLIGRTNRGALCDDLLSHGGPPDGVAAFHRAFDLDRPVDFIRALPSRPLATPLTPEAFEGESAFLRSPVYVEVFEPLGLRYLATAVLYREPGWHSFMTLSRPRGAQPFSSRELDLFGRLAEHFGRAMALRYALAAANATKALLGDIIDRFDRRAIVVDAKGTPRFVNRLARAILELEDGLVTSGERIAAAVPSETRELRRLVAECASTSAGEGLAAGGTLRISRSGNSRDYVVVVSPLATTMLAGLDDRALALVMIADPEIRAPPPEQLAAAFGLTAAESKLAVRLMLDEMPAEAAAALGISVSTVRFHLRNLLAKTGARRQAELVSHLRSAA